MTLGTAGDAAGTTGWIFEVGRQFAEQGWSVFLAGDQLKTTFFGAGLMDPVPVMNPLWRLLYVGVTSLGLSPNNNYDILIALQFMFAGFVGWFFSAAFGAKPFWRFVFVFLMLSVENTSQRMTGHNGLVFAYGPMLALAAALKFAQPPARSSGLWLFLALWFSFLSNEYLGYFSVWACVALVLAHDWSALKAQPAAYMRTQFSRVWVGALSFAFLMCLSHPSVTLFKVTALLNSLFDATPQAAPSTPSLRMSNPAHEFRIFGLKNPLALFDSGLIPLSSEVASKIYGRNPWEFSFRLGLILPIFIWWVWRRERAVSEKIQHKRILLATSLVMLLFALRTDLGLSLAWLTRFVAPMFRVSARAQFISLICMILLFTLCAQWFWERQRKHLGIIKTTFILAGVVLLAAFDLARSGPVFGQHVTFPISPLASLASHLQERPAGMALMVPTTHGQNESEHYFLSTVHRKPVLNAPFGETNARPGRILFALAETPGAQSLELLNRCGVRYLIVNHQAPRPPQLKSNPADWAQVDGLALVARNAGGSIYELPTAKDWPLLQELGSTTAPGTVAEASRAWLSKCTEGFEMSDPGEVQRK